MGSGKFSQLLSYADWLTFNNAQRVHQNTVEQSGYIFAMLAFSGLLYPLTAAKLGATYIVGRALFAVGYVRGGANGRMLGGLLGHIGDFGLMGCTIYGGGKMAGVF